jgi:hypothetical protein
MEKQSKNTIHILVYSPERLGGEVREVENSLKGFEALVGSGIQVALPSRSAASG